MTRSRPLKQSVVVTAADHPTGLGAARALRRLDVDIIGLYSEARASCLRSDVWSRLVHVGEGTPDAYLEVLHQIGAGSPDRLVLIPAQDEVVQLVSRSRDTLSEFYDFVLPDAETVDLLLDKTAFHAWATEHGFPVPESHIVASEGEMNAILGAIRYPVVLKPLYRTAAWQAKSSTDKVYKLHSREDYRRIGFDIFATAPKFVIQQWIEGRDDDVHFCLVYVGRDGQELAFQTGRKLLQWPPQTGSTAICTATRNAELHQLTREVFRRVGFRGLGSLEVKRSADDHQYYITEPTVGRPNLQSYLAVAAGVNLIALAYFDAVGQPGAFNASKRHNAIWIQEYFAAHAVLEAARNKQLAYRRMAGTFLKPGRIAFAHFGLADPGPFLNLLDGTLGQKLRSQRLLPSRHR